MCLAIPGQIVSIEGNYSYVNFSGVKKKVISALLPKLKVGDWVIVHAGYAIEILDEEAAKESLALWQELIEKELVDKSDYV